MNKKMRELMTQIETKTAEAKAFVEGENKDVEQANTIMNEVDALKAEFEVEAKMFEAEKMFKVEEKTVEEKAQQTATDDFAKNVRMIAKGMTVEGAGVDGGYAVPSDIQAKINKHKEAMVDLKKFVYVEPVSTMSGARTYQTKGQVAGFATVAEAASIPELANPKFERVEYVIEKYAGYLPVSNEVLNDAKSSGLEQTITEWFAKNSVATTNRLIVETAKTKSETDLKDLDGIKKAVTVTLGQAYKNSAILLTNDDGLHYLDCLKDGNDRPLLNPDPTAPAKWVLRMGNAMIPVEAVPNATMATVEGKVPFIVGDLKEGIEVFDREELSIVASTTASVGNVSAFGQDLTLFRGIERLDVVVRDAAAFVNGYIVVE